MHGRPLLTQAGFMRSLALLAREVGGLTLHSQHDGLRYMKGEALQGTPCWTDS